MPPAPRKKAGNNPNGQPQANVGYEEKLWEAADTLRGAMDAAEYKHIVLGLIFLKYVSDSYEERRQWLLRETADPKTESFVKKEEQHAYALEDRDEYGGQNVFWVPMKAPWQEIQKTAKRPEIGQLIADAMDLIGKSATLDEIRSHGHVLTPGRYVGAEAAEDDGEPFEQKMKRLTAELEGRFAESASLEDAIQQNLKGLGTKGWASIAA
jgi:type I restriction-modification system DNA methylase subunit